MEAAERRDASAEERDIAALVRDIAADARDLAMAQRDAVSQRDDDAPLSKSDRVIRTAGARRRAAERRAQAAEHRLLAAQDRRIAERDRDETARERQRSLTDREALLLELQREQHRAAQALELQQRAEKLVRTLQRSLSPPRLPSVEGLDVAVYYEPVADEAVGGDFYDLFQIAPGRLGFFFGDVCGNGPEAAAVTSLARHTLRTAAMLHDGPAAMLSALNAALLMDGDEQQTCTAVYGDIDIGCDRAAVSIAVAGHPAPLIVRARDGVEALSARGTMLGVVEAPAFGSGAVTLELGDALVVYSDGILDAKIDGVRPDEADVARLLAAGAPQASAQALVQRLVNAVRGDGPLHDDVAIMVLRRTTTT
jgi:sigma-B regulation protein RsbU (phosphoserine phosphatase)